MELVETAVMVENTVFKGNASVLLERQIVKDAASTPKLTVCIVVLVINDAQPTDFVAKADVSPNAPAPHR